MAFPLALGRVLYVLGLVGAGVALYAGASSPTQALKPLGYGLSRSTLALVFLLASALAARFATFSVEPFGPQRANLLFLLLGIRALR